MLIRRLALTATTLASSAVLAVTAAPHALADADSARRDRLVVTVAESGDTKAEGTHTLYCHPTGGDHPQRKAACDALDELTTWGKDPFAPLPRGTRCTMQYGGPASAHVRGVWAGRPVNAHFNRENGCEMRRWDALVPLLPSTGMRSAS